MIDVEPETIEKLKALAKDDPALMQDLREMEESIANYSAYDDSADVEDLEEEVEDLERQLLTLEKVNDKLEDENRKLKRDNAELKAEIDRPGRVRA